MAIIKANTGIYPEGQGYLQQYGFYTVANLSSSAGSYYHMKTNVAGSTYNMVMIEAVGYNFGNAAPLKCAWNMYSYSYQISNVQNSAYNGATANNVYISSDNYYVIVLYGASLYYCGFTLNAYNTAGNGYGFPTAIQAAVQTSGTSYY
jgi:hypothetical protein